MIGRSLSPPYPQGKILYLKEYLENLKKGQLAVVLADGSPTWKLL